MKKWRWGDKKRGGKPKGGEKSGGEKGGGIKRRFIKNIRKKGGGRRWKKETGSLGKGFSNRPCRGEVFPLMANFFLRRGGVGGENIIFWEGRGGMSANRNSL